MIILLAAFLCVFYAAGFVFALICNDEKEGMMMFTIAVFWPIVVLVYFIKNFKKAVGWSKFP